VRQAALATPHALATEAGVSAYRDGGTAIDAAIAAAAVLTVVYPHNVVVGMQVDGATADSATVESDVSPSAESAIRASGLPAKLVPPHTDAMGHTNVVFIDERGSMTAASDPRSDGAAVVTH
jgi:gamma-glutamyltranspeptidase